MINYESELAATIRNCDFQKLQDEMAKATKLACITVDYTGAPLPLTVAARILRARKKSPGI